MNIEDKILNLRKSRNMTQKDLAKKLNITQQGYSAYERGSSAIPLDILIKIANIYDIGIEEILRDTKYIKEENISYKNIDIIDEVLKDEKDKELLLEYSGYLLYRRNKLYLDKNKKM